MYIDTISKLNIKKVLSVNRLFASVRISTYRKNRPNWAIALKIHGKTIYTVNNTEVLSDSLHPVILPKGCSYSWRCIEPGECIIIEFEADSECTGFDNFTIADDNAILKSLRQMEKNLGSENTYSGLCCVYALYEIIIFLLKSADDKKKYHPQKYYLLKPAVKFITENYFDSNITNDFLADLCNMSTVYFRKAFTDLYGDSPIRFLHSLRINKAKAMLHTDYETVEQVALSVGYSSIYHFSKMFKLYTGISPGQYAKKTEY